ncbi:MAG: biotin/lipoyl-binding protein [SAR324 cluster bacterium]|nr:biotin/lipoyl-binding protein [SAR324 cluster bacterium]
MKAQVRRFLPLIIIVIGVLVSFGLIKSKSKPKRSKDNVQKIPIVRVQAIRKQSYQIHLQTHATSEPSQELAITPQVSGRVIAFAENFIDGSYVEKGQMLFQLDPIDSSLALEQAKASLAKAEYELENVEAQKDAALIGYRSFLKTQNKSQLNSQGLRDLKPNGPELSPLASFTPQLKNAKASLASADASFAMAELNYQRTTVTAPFSGYLRQATIAVGQQINAGQTVAQLFADRPVRFKVSIPLSDLPWVTVKGAEFKGAKVALVKEIGPQIHSWAGEVTHQFQEIDALGRMAQIMVEVSEPVSNHGFALPLNLQVNADIWGQTLEDVYVIPLSALKNNNKVWIAKNRDKLDIREVKVLRKEKEFALIKEGLNPDDLIITSPLEAAISGMSIKIYSEEKPASRTEESAQSRGAE